MFNSHPHLPNWLLRASSISVNLICIGLLFFQFLSNGIWSYYSKHVSFFDNFLKEYYSISSPPTSIWSSIEPRSKGCFLNKNDIFIPLQLIKSNQKTVSKSKVSVVFNLDICLFYTPQCILLFSTHLVSFNGLHITLSRGSFYSRWDCLRS